MTPLELALLILVFVLVATVFVILLRRGSPQGGDVGPQVVAALQPWLQTLQPLKETTDRSLPVIEKTGVDVQKFLQQADVQRQQEEKVVRDHLTKLMEATKTAPEVHRQVAVLQKELEKLKSVERGVRELQEVFLSTQGRGKMGEEAIRAQFEPLPSDLWDEQFAIDGRRVDFIVRMPNGRILPIDSKTSGITRVREYFDLSQQLQATEEEAERRRLGLELRKLSTDVRRAVLAQAEAVSAYIQPDKATLPLAIQAVPDSLYSFLDAKARREAAEMHVQIVPYGLVLVVVNVLRSQNQYDRIDLDAVVGSMHAIRLQTRTIEDVLENKFSKAAKFLSSGIEEVRDAVVHIDRNTTTVETSDGDTGGAVVRVPVKRVEKTPKPRN